MAASSLDQPESADEGEVRMLYFDLIDGWNAGSGERFAAPFAEDADYVALDGTYTKGRAEIATSHHRLFTHGLAGSRLVGKVRAVRFLKDDVAIMHAIGGTVMPGETDVDPERNAMQTLVFAKTGGDWRVAAFQNTRIDYLAHPELNTEIIEELRLLV